MTSSRLELIFTWLKLMFKPVALQTGFTGEGGRALSFFFVLQRCTADWFPFMVWLETGLKQTVFLLVTTKSICLFVVGCQRCVTLPQNFLAFDSFKVRLNCSERLKRFGRNSNGPVLRVFPSSGLVSISPSRLCSGDSAPPPPFYSSFSVALLSA